MVATLVLVGLRADLGAAYWAGLGVAALLVAYEFRIARHRHCDADEDRQANPVVVQEGAEAGAALAVAGDAEFVGDQQRCNAQAGPVRSAEISAQADQYQRRDHQRIQEALCDQIEPAEQDGGGLAAHAEIVVAVDHGVPGVVGSGPQDVGGIQQPAQQRHAALHGGEGHRDAPAERHAQIDLRQVGMALEVGVAGGQEDAGHAQHHGQPVEREHQREGRQHQRHEYP
ncbi:putative 4-hydroxybenzoate octaprenyltransferase protein [Xanthomonas citri pv. fuscans]|nr:putative 4-hydroxybenzoate octaprenyltransferase protein [Xanthomonas citri pv. fuscans]